MTPKSPSWPTTLQPFVLVASLRLRLRQNGIICNANNGTNSQTNYRNTIDDNSIEDTTKGATTKGTIDDISTRKIVQGAKLGS
jgi:hypothetical protein